MTMVTTSGEREAILPMISDCACAEKPRPPCSFEMSMPRKPRDLTKSQILSGISRCAWRTCQSSIMPHSSSVGPSRKACSSGVRTMGAMERSLSQSGVPENSSASKPTVPASSACCLGVGDLRQRAFDELEDGRADVVAANGGNGERRKRHDEQPQQEAEDARVPVHGVASARSARRRRARRPKPRAAPCTYRARGCRPAARRKTGARPCSYASTVVHWARFRRATT